MLEADNPTDTTEECPVSSQPRQYIPMELHNSNLSEAEKNLVSAGYECVRSYGADFSETQHSLRIDERALKAQGFEVSIVKSEIEGNGMGAVYVPGSHIAWRVWRKEKVA